MKLRKMKLVALALSVAMVASTMSPAVLAAEEEIIIADELTTAEVAEADGVTATSEMSSLPVAVDAPKEVAAPAENAESDNAEVMTISAVPAADMHTLVFDDRCLPVTWHYDDENLDGSIKKSMDVTYYLWDVTDDELDEVERHATATIFEEKSADCIHPGTIRLQVIIPENTEYKLYSDYETEPATGKHDYEKKEEVIEWPTHTQEGRMRVWEECKVCHEKKAAPLEETIPKSNHTWPEKPNKYVRGENIKWDAEKNQPAWDENGNAVLDNVNKDGYYTEVYVCPVDNEEKTVRKDILAKGGYQDYIEVLADGNVSSIYDGLPADQMPTDANEIILEDCSKPGKYNVVRKNSQGRPIAAIETVTVPAHHTYGSVVYEFESQADKDQCIYNPSNGTLTNKVCNKDVTYYEVRHCVSTKCPDKGDNKQCATKSYVYGPEQYVVKNAQGKQVGVIEGYPDHDAATLTTKKVLDKSNANHITLTNLENAITDLQNRVSKPNTWLEQYICRYDDLVTWLNTGDSFEQWEITQQYINTQNALNFTLGNHKPSDVVRILNNTSTCEKNGVVTLGYTCLICGQKDVRTQEVKVAPRGHKKSTFAIQKNVVEATCTSEGSYDAVIGCEREGCDKVYEKRENIAIPRKAHTNENEKTYNESTKDYTEYETADDTLAIRFVGDVVVGNTWVDSSDSRNTLEITYDEDYWSKNNVFAGTRVGYRNNDELSVFVQPYTVCENCGGNEHVLSSNKVLNKTLKNYEVKVTDVKKQGKSCQPGSITISATYTATVDGEEKTVALEPQTFEYWSTINAYQGKTQHQWGDPTTVTVKEPTATEDGLRRTTVKCAICGTEESTDEVIPATGAVVLPAVTNVDAEAVSQGTVKVTWDAVEGAEGYFIFACNKNHNGEMAGTVVGGDVTEWTDKNAKTDNYSLYWVTAFDKDANGKVVQGTNNKAEYDYAIAIKLAKVTGVSATASNNGVSLRWNAVKNANSYLVLAKDGGKGDYVVKEVAYGTSYVDTTATSESVRAYWVIATYEGNDDNRLAAGPASDFVATRALAK